MKVYELSILKGYSKYAFFNSYLTVQLLNFIKLFTTSINFLPILCNQNDFYASFSKLTINYVFPFIILRESLLCDFEYGKFGRI
jgi:hypothetical protein